MTTMRDTEHGVAFLNGLMPTYVEVLYSDPERGTWLIVGTEHAAVEVRVTPKGRKVTATESTYRPPSSRPVDNDVA